MAGKIHASDKLLLRSTIGDAKDENGNVYEMSLLNYHTPLVTNKKTQKSFSISWPEIIDMAKDAGIDET